MARGLAVCAFLASVAVLFPGGRARAAERAVTLASLLEEMIDRDEVARWPEPPYTCRQASSYDRRSRTPDDPGGWFANTDNMDGSGDSLRWETISGRRECVLLDVEGPGCIVRFWSGGQRPAGAVRFYIDGSDTPAIEAPLFDLLSGRSFVPRPLAVETAGAGINLYLPVPYARHCKITYDEARPGDPQGPPPGRWYNVEYRTYPEGTEVRPFTMDGFRALARTVERVCATLLVPPEPAGGRTVEIDRAVAPGGRASAALPAGPGAVRLVEMRLEGVPEGGLEQALRSVVLRATFDGEETVWCPAGDFFGSGTGLNALRSWYRAAEPDGRMSCRWVMPYERSGLIALANFGRERVTVRLRAVVGRWRWDGRSMHFRANWRQEAGIRTRPFQDWNYVEASGRGVYLGDTLSLLNPVGDWWGEGDEKIRVDGEAFPSHFGTGTEDYYGYAWGNTALFQSPFLNQVRVDGPGNRGHTVVTRARALDAIPFEKSLRTDMEIWHWKDCQVTYAAATYWYARPGATTNRGPEAAEAAREIFAAPEVARVKGALEGEQLAIAERTGGATEVQRLDQFGWSGAAQLWWRDAKPGDTLALKLPVARAGRYSVAVNLTKAVDYGIVQFHIDGGKLGAPVDLYNDGVVTTGPLVLGSAELAAGEHRLVVEIVGANDRAVKRHMLGLDYVKLDEASPPPAP